MSSPADRPWPSGGGFLSTFCAPKSTPNQKSRWSFMEKRADSPVHAAPEMLEKVMKPVPTYLTDHETKPSQKSIITTDTQNILVRDLQLRKLRQQQAAHKQRSGTKRSNASSTVTGKRSRRTGQSPKKTPQKTPKTPKPPQQQPSTSASISTSGSSSSSSANALFDTDLSFLRRLSSLASSQSTAANSTSPAAGLRSPTSGNTTRSPAGTRLVQSPCNNTSTRAGGSGSGAGRSETVTAMGDVRVMPSTGMTNGSAGTSSKGTRSRSGGRSQRDGGCEVTDALMATELSMLPRRSRR